MIRPIPGFPQYRVTDDGVVWSHHPRWLAPRPLVPSRVGRPHVSLYREGRVYTRGVHRLVLEAFVGPCPPGMESAHNNGNPYDNRLQNLRWATRASNMADKVQHGTAPRGERNPAAKMTASNADEIRRRYQAGHTSAELAEDFGVTRQMIWRIVRGLNWRVA